MSYLLLNHNGVENLCLHPNSGSGPDYMTTLNENQKYSSTKKVKRFRSAFTTDQVHYLEKQFKKFPYIGNAHRKEVAIALNIPERAVKIWFQNRRMKEKKETSSKEFNDEQTNRKSVEFAKDQLNNVSEPSANDQRQYTLAMLTDIKKPEAAKNVLTNDSPCNITIRHPIKVKCKYNGSKNQDIGLANFAKINLSPSIYESSAEFSINLCKKQKTEPKEYTEHLHKVIEQKPINQNSSDEQLLPEDLSSSRKTFASSPSSQNTFSEPSRRVTNNQGYYSVIPTISSLYAQPYMLPGGVFWKPIGVMPVAPTGSLPSPILNDQVKKIPGLSTVSKRNCNCNCHIKSPDTMNHNSPNPEYIITTLPFQNPSAKFEPKSD